MSTISKQECLNLLFELKNNGVDTSAQIKTLLLQKSPSIEIIKFINDHKELDIRRFYEKLRRSYNDKHSKLYINIVKCNEIDSDELICCAGALLQQILLFNRNAESNDFLTQARFNEILDCLKHYYETKDLIQVRTLLNLVKADLKILEEISIK
jgi:hypothetical protein